MYSFGLLLQWLFTGSHPFPINLSQDQVFKKAGNGETLPPDGVEEDLRRLIERLKTFDPTGRPRALDTVERGRDVKVIDVLSYWEEQLETEFHDDPLIKARLLNQLGTTYRRLGEYEKAESIVTECLDFTRSRSAVIS